MSVPFLVGSGYFSNAQDAAYQQWFFDLWSVNTPYPAVIIDNADVPLVVTNRPDVRVIRTANALGHAFHTFRGKTCPHFSGTTASWMLGAWVAYGEQKDFLYKEQDCLAFGRWVEDLYETADREKADVVFGEQTTESSEHCLHLVKWHAIPFFYARYVTQFEDGDGVMMPEDKWTALSKLPGNPLKMAQSKMPGGRLRPLQLNAPAWNAQKFCPSELEEVLARCPLRSKSPFKLTSSV